VVINVGARTSRPAVSSDEASTSWSPAVIGLAMAAGGTGALWRGLVLRRAGDTDDSSASRLTRWTWWCTSGDLLVIAGVWIVIRST
jgi:hypothetical protein